MVNPGGRPARIATDDIVRVGRRLGLRDLSISAVAAELGVSGAALYRHVDHRWDLERLVGESILADLVLVDEPEHDLEQHLVAFGLQLHDFVLAHPGVGAYLQQLFPRGEAGRALLVAEVEALARRGYGIEAALAVTNAVAGTAIGQPVRAASGPPYEGSRGAALHRDFTQAACTVRPSVPTLRHAPRFATIRPMGSSRCAPSSALALAGDWRRKASASASCSRTWVSRSG